MLLLLLACYPELPFVEQPCETWEEPGTYVYKFEYDGKNRKALVYVPGTEGPRTMVMALHGAGGNGTDFGVDSGLYRLASSEEFVLSAPWGLGLYNHWNAGDCCGTSHDKGVDDFGALEQLVTDMRSRVCVDTIYAYGHSNGAMMAHHWACEGGEVSALVAASGNLETATCGEVGDTPVPVRHYHGTDDPVIPIDGSPNQNDKVYQSTAHTMEQWRIRNQCTDTPPIVTQEGAATCESWDCAASTVLCTIEGGLHHWPGSRPNSEIDEPDATRAGWSWIQEVAGPSSEEQPADTPDSEDLPPSEEG